MNNKLLFALLALLLVPATAFGQEGWDEVQAPVHLQYEGVLHAGPLAHGVVVDNNGRIWISPYNGEEGITVYNQDGTQASFSPIQSVTIDGTEIPTLAGGRGITVDHEGHIVAVVNNSVLVRLDEETGEGMSFWEGPSSLTSPAVDQDGYVYVSAVAGSEPIYVLSLPEFGESFQIEEGSEWTWWSRATAVTGDGTTVASGRLGGGVVLFQSEDLINYELTDTLITDSEGGKFFAGDASSVQFDSEGLLWATDEGASWTDTLHTRSIKVFNVEQKTYYTLDHDSLDLLPRGVGFANGGETVYVSAFGTGRTQIFTVAEGPSTDIEDGVVATGFTLEQSYPNPFSSSTTIRYALDEPGEVTLRVYDVLGREVKTLVAAKQVAGTHSASWDATDAAGQLVSNGTYFYSLEVEDRRVTKAMVVAK